MSVFLRAGTQDKICGKECKNFFEKTLDFPAFRGIITIVPSRTAANKTEYADMAVIGPASPGIGKINDIYRKVIYLKSEDERILMAVKDRMEKYIEINRGFQSLKIQFDMNP